jgi:peptidoglycan/xylan/chitin deacetylase (PgdA/CDA1 family)
MAHLSEEEQRRELSASAEALRGRLGVPAAFFAYPFGAFNGRSRDLAQEAGYRAALAVQKGLGSRFGMLRTSVHRAFPDVVENELRRAFGAPPGQP